MTTTEAAPPSARAFLWTILLMLAAVLILLMLPLAIRPAHAQGVAPDAEPIPVTSADVLELDAGEQGPAATGLVEWLTVVGALLLALGKALQVNVKLLREIRVLISGVETGGDRGTKAAIAVKAERAGVGKRLAKRVERETTRRPKPATDPDTGG